MRMQTNIAIFFLHSSCFLIKDSIPYSLFCTYLFSLGNLPILIYRELLYFILNSCIVSHWVCHKLFRQSPTHGHLAGPNCLLFLGRWQQDPEGLDHCYPPPNPSAGFQRVQHKRLVGMKLSWRKSSWTWSAFEDLETSLLSELGVEGLS